MFGKNNNTYLFPSPSLHHHHHHHHPDVFSGHHHHHYKDNIVQALVENHHHQASAAGFLNNNQAEVDQKKVPSVTKKDRHSKIFTSQGPRDRRVRLSIGIARKFFDLQEMLGFDKPSKTLDWLLTKSKSSIKDLIVQTTKQKSRNDLDDEEDDDNKNSSSPILPGELGGNDKGRSGNIKNKGSSSSLKESRAKARARARERTREKMCIKQQQQLTNSSEVNYVNSVGANFQQQQQLVEESVLIKRKPSSSSSSFLGFQQNVFVSGYDHDHDQNWDVCSFASQANLCAILDQHKFMNSSSNM